MPRSTTIVNSAPALVGDPVDTLTGAVFDSKLEFRLTGPLELRWFRHYNGGKRDRQFALGWGHTHEYDRALTYYGDHFAYEMPVGEVVEFPPLRLDGGEYYGSGFVFRRLTGLRYQLLRNAEPGMEFAFSPDHPTARLTRVFRGSSEIRFVYGVGRVLERIVDSTGRVILVDEAADRRLQRLTLAGSRSAPETLLIAYEYDHLGNLVATRNGFGHGHTFHYDQASRLVRVTGRKGFQFEYEYDDVGRCVRASGENALYGVVLSYQVPRHLTKVTRADGGVWTYTFDQAGGLTRILDPNGSARKFIRDEKSRLLAEVDPNLNVTKVVYDAAGAPVARIDSFGHRSALPEDPNAPDPLGHRVAANPAEFAYGRLLDSRDITLPVPGEVLQLPAEVRRVVAMRVLADASNSVEASFDVPPLGALWWPEPPLGRVFNALGKLVEQHDELGRVRRWTYDASGNPATYLDFDGARWEYDYSRWHLVSALRTPLGGEVRYTYTTNAEVASFTDADGARSDFEVDQRDWLVAVKRHGVVRDRYTRDGAGNLIAKHGGEGQELLRLEIGAGNRPIKRVLASGDEHNFKYDESGRYLSATTSRDSVEFAYDALGHRTADKRNGLGASMSFAGWRKLSELVLFDRFVVHYERLADRTLRITDPGGESHEIHLHPHGLVERCFGNGSREIEQYDNLGRCQVKVAWRGNHGVWTRKYFWSGEGELRQIEDNLFGGVRHEYDGAHRLRRRIIDGQIEEYRLDVADNLLQQPGLDGVRLRDGNRLERTTAERFVYNDRNHVELRETKDGTTRYKYDSRDQLVGVETPHGEWAADYDALGRRTRKRWNGKTTEYYWQTDQLIAEVSPNGQLRLYLYCDPLALTPLLMLEYAAPDAPGESCKRYYVYSDQIGVPSLVEDSQHKEVWRGRAAPFGRIESAAEAKIEFNLRFPGHYFDAELGLHYNRFRYYDPALGRYLQSDPWGITGGYNLYAYPTNPLLHVDVRGLGEEEGKKGKGADEGGEDDEENKPLHERIGWVDEYGEQKKVTGDGSADRDHQPSKAAIKKAAADEIARQVAAGEIDKPTAAQIKEINNRIDNEAMSVVVDHDVHKDGPTYGNKNKTQSDIDKQDLGAAANRDADAMVANAAKHDPDNLPAYQAAADKIKEQTHDSIMDKTKGIISDVMNEED